LHLELKLVWAAELPEPAGKRARLSLRVAASCRRERPAAISAVLQAVDGWEGRFDNAPCVGRWDRWGASWSRRVFVGPL